MNAHVGNSFLEDLYRRPSRKTIVSNKSVHFGISTSKDSNSKPILSGSTTRPKSRHGATTITSASTTLNKPCSSSVTNGISTAETQLKDLSPSAELLSYYQQKMEQFNIENIEMQEKLRSYISICDFSHQLEQELAQRNEEISCLHEINSDLQVHLYQDRKQSLKLHAENNLLKTQEFEDRRRIQLLLKLSDLTETDLEHFVASSRGTCVHKKLGLPPSLQNLNRRLILDSNVKSRLKKRSDLSSNKLSDLREDLNEEVVRTEAHNNAMQLDKQQTLLAENFVQSLLKDRELTQKEHQADRNRFEAHISSLSSRLKLTQDKLCTATQDLLAFQEDYRSKEIKWVRQKAQIQHELEFCQEHLGESLPNLTAYRVSGIGMSEKCSSHMKVGNLSMLKKELEDKECLISLYRKQSGLLEEEMDRLRLQSEAYKSGFKEQTKKMSDQLIYLKSKYDELNRRRILDAEGFHNDIKLLRNRFHNVEKKFKKVHVSLPSAKLAHICKDNPKQVGKATHDTTGKAKHLNQELRLIKNKIVENESYLKN